MADQVKQHLLDRWQQAVDSGELKAKQKWWTDARKWLYAQQNPSHWWCRHGEVVFPLACLLYYDQQPVMRELAATMTEQLSCCHDCVLRYHDYKDRYEQAVDDKKDWEKLMQVLRREEAERVVAGLRSTFSVNQGDPLPEKVTCALYEVFSYPELLEDQEVMTSLATTLLHLAQDYDIRDLAEGGRYGGLYAMLAHPEARVRSLVTPSVKALGRFVEVGDVAPIRPVLERWVAVLEGTGPVTETCAGQRPVFALNKEDVLKALKIVMEFMEAGVLRHVLEEYRGLVDSLVNHCNLPALTNPTQSDWAMLVTGLRCVKVLLSQLEGEVFQFLHSCRPHQLCHHLMYLGDADPLRPDALKTLVEVMELFLCALLPCSADPPGELFPLLRFLLVQLPNKTKEHLRQQAMQSGLRVVLRALHLGQPSSFACHHWLPPYVRLLADLQGSRMEAVAVTKRGSGMSLSQGKSPGSGSQGGEVDEGTLSLVAVVVATALQVDALALWRVLNKGGSEAHQLPSSFMPAVGSISRAADVVMGLSEADLHCCPMLWRAVAGCSHPVVSTAVVAAGGLLSRLEPAGEDPGLPQPSGQGRSGGFFVDAMQLPNELRHALYWDGSSFIENAGVAVSRYPGYLLRIYRQQVGIHLARLSDARDLFMGNAPYIRHGGLKIKEEPKPRGPGGLSHEHSVGKEAEDKSGALLDVVMHSCTLMLCSLDGNLRESSTRALLNHAGVPSMEDAWQQFLLASITAKDAVLSALSAVFDELTIQQGAVVSILTGSTNVAAVLRVLHQLLRAVNDLSSMQREVTRWCVASGVWQVLTMMVNEGHPSSKHPNSQTTLEELFRLLPLVLTQVLRHNRDIFGSGRPLVDFLIDMIHWGPWVSHSKGVCGAWLAALEVAIQVVQESKVQGPQGLPEDVLATFKEVLQPGSRLTDDVRIHLSSLVPSAAPGNMGMPVLGNWPYSRTAPRQGAPGGSQFGKTPLPPPVAAPSRVEVMDLTQEEPAIVSPRRLPDKHPIEILESSSEDEIKLSERKERINRAAQKVVDHVNGQEKGTGLSTERKWLPSGGSGLKKSPAKQTSIFEGFQRMKESPTKSSPEVPPGSTDLLHKEKAEPEVLYNQNSGASTFVPFHGAAERLRLSALQNLSQRQMWEDMKEDKKECVVDLKQQAQADYIPEGLAEEELWPEEWKGPASTSTGPRPRGRAKVVSTKSEMMRKELFSEAGGGDGRSKRSTGNGLVIVGNRKGEDFDVPGWRQGRTETEARPAYLMEGTRCQSPTPPPLARLVAVEEEGLLTKAPAPAGGKPRLGLGGRGINQPQGRTVLRHCQPGLPEKSVNPYALNRERMAEICRPALKMEDVHHDILSWNYFRDIVNPRAGRSLGGLKVPHSFSTLELYSEVFRRLLMEEMRASLSSTHQEMSSGGVPLSCFSVRVTHMLRQNDCQVITFRVEGGAEGQAVRDNYREQDLVLITKQPVGQPRELQELLARRAKSPGPQGSQTVSMLLALVEGVVVEGGYRIVRAKVLQEAVNRETGASRSQGPRAVMGINTCWWMLRVDSLIPHLRQFQALCQVHSLAPRLRDYILRPVASGRGAPQMLDKTPLPRVMYRELQARYNKSQEAAIAACLDATNHFTLVQGPPGTGKTSSIMGIISVLLAKGCLRGARDVDQEGDTRGARGNGGVFVNMRTDSKRTAGAQGTSDAEGPLRLGHNPTIRVLVCAQSNAAIDELVHRLAEEGVWRTDGCRKPPALVRMGRSDQTHASVLALHVDALAEQLAGQHKGSSMRSEKDQKTRQQLEEWNEEYNRLSKKVEEVERKNDEEVEEGEAQQGPNSSLSAAEVRGLKDRCRLLWGRIQAGERELRQGNKELDRQKKEVRQAVVKAAEVVACTLSSAGGDLVGMWPPGHAPLFDALVIDEAAQALEPSALIPFSLLKPSSKIVLVGDPRQLPPTVLSREAEAAALAQSLFERLQLAGSPVVMLDQQYRMHPIISRFPSQYFYDGKLVDGESISPDRCAAAFHSKPCFPPFAFFDCHEGREQGAGGGGSLRNRAEAELAAVLCRGLKEEFAEHVGRIAVLSPYRAQLRELSQAFKAQFGRDVGEMVDFATVDGYQGREADVVIFTAVRAQAGEKGTSVGFLNDVRRMNVAITRARRSLWVIGHLRTLINSKPWRALLEYTQQQGLLFTATKPFKSLLKRTTCQLKPQHPVNLTEMQVLELAPDCSDEGAVAVNKKRQSENGEPTTKRHLAKQSSAGVRDACGQVATRDGPRSSQNRQNPAMAAVRGVVTKERATSVLPPQLPQPPARDSPPDGAVKPAIPAAKPKDEEASDTMAAPPPSVMPIARQLHVYNDLDGQEGVEVPPGQMGQQKRRMFGYRHAREPLATSRESDRKGSSSRLNHGPTRGPEDGRQSSHRVGKDRGEEHPNKRPRVDLSV